MVDFMPWHLSNNSTSFDSYFLTLSTFQGTAYGGSEAGNQTPCHRHSWGYTFHKHVSALLWRLLETPFPAPRPLPTTQPCTGTFQDMHFSTQPSHRHRHQEDWSGKHRGHKPPPWLDSTVLRKSRNMSEMITKIEQHLVQMNCLENGFT